MNTSNPNPKKPVSDCLPPVPAIGAPIQTACGGTAAYTANTPCAYINGQNVYFCLGVCVEGFENDPENSCVAIGPYKNLI